jgi:hypothetical protein
MDLMIYHLIGATIVSTFLFAMGWLNVIKITSAIALLCSPFGFAVVFLARSGVITL